LITLQTIDSLDRVLLTGIALLGAGMIYACLRLLKRNAHAGLLSILVALGGAGCIIATLLRQAFTTVGSAEPNTVFVTVITAGVAILLGVAMWLRERHFEGYLPSRSFNALYIGTGLFLLFSTVMIPIIPSQLVAAPPTRAATGMPTLTRTPVPTRTLRETLTATPIPTLTKTPTALPTLTITPTVAQLVLPTQLKPSATSTPTESPCVVTVIQDRVNLRAAPSTNAAILTKLALNASGRGLQRTADGTWWQVQIGADSGWVSSELITTGAGCAELPTATP
jgi:hypothetical protein